MTEKIPYKYVLADVFRLYPKCMTDRNLFKAILVDMFSTDKAYINLLLMCFDDGIINEISEGVSNLYEYDKYIKRLLSDIIEKY